MLNKIQVLELTNKLDYEHCCFLLKTWLRENTLDFEQAINLMSICNTSVANKMQEYKDHASAAEFAGAESLITSTSLERLQNAKVHIDKFKHKSFLNYDWLEPRINKLKGKTNAN